MDDIPEPEALEAIDVAIDSRSEAIVKFMNRNPTEIYDWLMYIKIEVDALVAADLSLTKVQHNRLAKIHHHLGKLLKP